MLLGILCVALFTVLVKNATAITDEQRTQVHAKFLEVGIGCLKEYPLSVEDLTSFKEKKFPDGENAPCFTSCVLKNVGIFDDKGSLSPNNALENAKKVFKDEDDLKNFEGLLIACSKVNEEEVSGGENGCERAKLAFSCLVDNADKFGYNIDF